MSLISPNSFLEDSNILHGGLRYLPQGQFELVREGLIERDIMLDIAPTFTRELRFVLPAYKFRDIPRYYVGLNLYDYLAGKQKVHPSRYHSRREVVAISPNLKADGLKGAYSYSDAQFDDTLLALALAKYAASQGAALANYTEVRSLVKSGGIVTGARVWDRESGEIFQVQAKVVVNATGPASNRICEMDDSSYRPTVRPSQGIHIVIPRKFYPGEYALAAPSTDGRIFFVMPRSERYLLIGTTDLEVRETEEEPLPTTGEIELLLANFNLYTGQQLTRAAITSCFAGLRPLISGSGSSASLSRDYRVFETAGGMIVVQGGKWTIGRKMGSDVADRVLRKAQLPWRACSTTALRLNLDRAACSEMIQREIGNPLVKLHPDWPLTRADVAVAARFEMARTIADVLARRHRVLQLDARAAWGMAPQVARLIAVELNLGGQWISDELKGFEALGRRYLPPGAQL